MALTNQNISYEYIADGNTNVFPFSCRVILASDLSVFINGDQVTNFIITGLDNDNGGNVVFESIPVICSRILIICEIPLERRTDNQTKSVSRNFDHICMGLHDDSSIKSNLANTNDEKLGSAWLGVKQPFKGAIARTQHDKNKERVSVFDFMTTDEIADSQCIDPVLDLTKPIKIALNCGAKRIHIPAGRYRISEMIEIPTGVFVEGDGVDYWDTYRPAPDRLLKSWTNGTHLIFIGTGIKNQSALNLNNVHTPKEVGGISYPFTEFTNNDSVKGNSATAKLFSVAVKITNSSQLSNLRIMINCDGISGYNNESNLSLGDEWDVGLWVYDSSTTIIENVQVVGYWRIAGTLLTENDGTYNMRGNPESTIFNNGLTQGMRGLLIRNMPEYTVNNIDTVNNTITIEYNPSFTLTATNQFKLIGSGKTYTFTGYYVNNDNTLITFQNVTPKLPPSALVMRPANIGNNFSGTVFNDYKAVSLDHHSKNSSDNLGQGQAGALEITGYPMRNLKFINFKAQTTYDKLNSLFGDMRDAKFISCEHENGAMIAYNMSESCGYTGNIRYINSDLQDSCDLSAFNPRDCFIDYKQMPTRITDGTFIIKNWRAKNLDIQYANGVTGVSLKDSDKNLQLKNGNNQTVLYSAGSSNALNIYGDNINFKNSFNETMLTIFSKSKNIYTQGHIIPSDDNLNSLGSNSKCWKNIFTGSGVIQTSDARFKQQIESFSNVEKRVAIKLKSIIKKFKYNDSVKKKSENARIHIGVLAQEVKDVFNSEGLDAFEYGIICYDEWKEQDKIKNTYGIRYDELTMFILAAL